MIRQVDWDEVPRGTVDPRPRDLLRPASDARAPDDSSVRAPDLVERLHRALAPELVPQSRQAPA